MFLTAMLRMIFVFSVWRYGNFSTKKSSIPSLSRPIEFNNPEAVSTVRGGAFPERGRSVTVFGMIPPSREKSTTPSISLA
jgi:hypothetical protein